MTNSTISNAVSLLKDAVYSVLCRMKGNYFRSYSQFGEDVLLRAYMEDRWADRAYKGFWVDVGAHHPVKASNTKLFSERGWSGINIDADVNAIRAFTHVRRKDINLNVGIGEQQGELDFYTFGPDSLWNTFSKEFAEKAANVLKREYVTRKVPVLPLKSVLEKKLPKGKHIDFFTIDTEGLDVTILRSNDWKKYRPDFVLIEIHTQGHNETIADCAATRFLKDVGYEYAGQCLLTALYRKVKA